MSLWNMDAPGNKVQIEIRQNLSKSYIFTLPIPGACDVSKVWSIPISYMNLQSKFGYCIISQTLKIALCL